jgi:hypothetical protein
MKVLICGGRDFTNAKIFKSLMEKYKKDITEVIQSGARGADRLAKEWAIAEGIPQTEFSADWDLHGKAAGIIRNTRMLVEGQPDMVIAMPGGKGAENMINQACKAGLDVYRYSYE